MIGWLRAFISRANSHQDNRSGADNQGPLQSQTNLSFNERGSNAHSSSDLTAYCIQILTQPHCVYDNNVVEQAVSTTERMLAKPRAPTLAKSLA
jgi:hypothetical protein